MIHVVLDNNVFISGLFWNGTCRKVVDLAMSGSFISYTSREILQELEQVLYEDFIDIPRARIEEIIKDILSFAHVVPARRMVVKQLRDIKDAKIISCAISSGADYIVTGDKDLLVLKEYRNIKILSPREFLDCLD
jgi:uncharacterized protein